MHQHCLLKWISERGCWTCELCCYRFHIIAINMKRPWQVRSRPNAMLTAKAFCCAESQASLSRNHPKPLLDTCVASLRLTTTPVHTDCVKMFAICREFIHFYGRQSVLMRQSCRTSLRCMVCVACVGIHALVCRAVTATEVDKPPKSSKTTKMANCPSKMYHFYL